MQINVFDLIRQAGGGQQEAGALGANAPGRNAFLDIHYGGSSATAAALPQGGKNAFLDIHYGGSSAADVAQPQDGKNAFLNIHYGKSAGDVAALPQGGRNAFLDIHYGGSSAASAVGGGGFAPESGPLVSHSSAVPGLAAGPSLANMPGRAAFLDIHYGGSMGVDLAAAQRGGTQAFLDIHYHG